MSEKTKTRATDKLIQPEGCEQHLERLHQEVLELREQVSAAERAVRTTRPAAETS